MSGYLDHQPFAEAERAPERFFMNVALARVLYTHAAIAAPRLALGRLAPVGRLAADPRLGMAGVFLSLRRVLPNRYPLAGDVEGYIADEQAADLRSLHPCGWRPVTCYGSGRVPAAAQNSALVRHCPAGDGASVLRALACRVARRTRERR